MMSGIEFRTQEVITMPVHYKTIVAKRIRDKRGKERFEEVASILGPKVPDMNEDEYYDELARRGKRRAV